jgi:hypothetical protein
MPSKLPVVHPMNAPRLPRALLLVLIVPMVASAADWRPLFNGRDFSGWETYLGKPHPASRVPGLARDDKGAYTGAIGLDRDPLGNFTVVTLDDRPALRISGEGFGYLVTREEFTNYHLRLQFRWGDKKWPPREQAVRDSGLLYHVHGAPAVSSGVWPACVELQIQEQDCGDLFAIATRVSVPAAIVETEGRVTYQYAPDSLPIDFKQERPVGNRCVRLADHEKPYGEWNTIELISIGGDSIHIVNGRIVMRLHDARRKGEDGVWLPLTAGRIALQTEGAEIFYRDIEIRPITAVPAEYAQ